MEPAFRLRGIGKTYRGRGGARLQALADISLEVAANEVVAVAGPSGCGKSSLLRILAGLDSDYEGGLDWGRGEAALAAGKRLVSATVFQSDSTLPWMSVEKNLAVGLAGLSLTRAERDARIARYLGLVGLADFRRAFPHELSGGMRQRVAIARALAAEPLLLLMDEPLAALDAQTRLVMQQELLRIWAETRRTVVYITHDIGEALTLADRVVVMSARPGRIKSVLTVPFGAARDVFAVRRRPDFGVLETEIWQSMADEVGASLGGHA
jgi:ABC-type nitrate/sulfonate/bicarbonate transport system ATPase subunit